MSNFNNATTAATVTTVTTEEKNHATMTEYKCTYCQKIFYSKATLDIHLMTKRHDWQLKKAIEIMENGGGNQTHEIGTRSTLQNNGNYFL